MVGGPKLEDYLEQGIHGVKEIKAGERKRFLGTIRERIVIALYEKQVYENKIYPEVEKEMKNHPNTRLLLSAEIPYNFLSKYIKIANKNNISFKIVENKEFDTDIGLVLAYDDKAIEKEEIFITNEKVDKKAIVQNKTKKAASNPKKSLKRLIKKILK